MKLLSRRRAPKLQDLAEKAAEERDCISWERQEDAACFNEALHRRLCARKGRSRRKSMLPKL